MDLQPTLKSILLTLEPLQETDLEAMYKIASDPLIWEQHPNSNRYTRAEFEKYFDGAIESKGAFKVIDNETKGLIGCTRFYEYDERSETIKIGYTFLIRSHWGGNYNREMKTLLLDHAFRSIPTVLFEIDINNLRSQRAILKIGGKLDSTHMRDGTLHQVYRIRKADWKSQN